MPTRLDLQQKAKLETERLFANVGLPPVDSWSNEKVRDFYGTCSKEDHALQVLQHNRDEVERYANVLNRLTGWPMTAGKQHTMFVAEDPTDILICRSTASEVCKGSRYLHNGQMSVEPSIESLEPLLNRVKVLRVGTNHKEDESAV